MDCFVTITTNGAFFFCVFGIFALFLVVPPKINH